MDDDVYKPPNAELCGREDGVREEIADQAKVLASGFRMVLYGLYLLLASIVSLMINASIPTLILTAVGAGLCGFGIVIIGIGEKNSILLGLFYLLLCLIPIVNVIALAVILKRVAGDLRRNSYQVSIWGVTKVTESI
jgi:ABC-type phosphate transport system permease subunit